MMTNYIPRMIGGLAVTSSLLFTSCSSKNPDAVHAFGGPVPVVTAEVKLSSPSYFADYPGTVVALNQVELRPQVNGYISGIYFKDGDRVTKGQKLYTIDAQLYAANYNQAVADLQVQQTNLVKAQKDADRYHALEKDDAIAKQQVDYADAALAAAQKQVEAAKANVQGVQTSVNYTTIVAPFNGTIGISQVKAQTAVTAGVTLLNTVSTDDPIAVDFVIDQKDIYHFTQLQHKKTPRGDSTFTLVFGTDDNYPYPGEIYFLDRAVDAQTGTLKVRLQFPNKENSLRAGMSCDVRVRNQITTPQICIPYKAVTEQLGDYFVYVVNGNKVSQQKIIPGAHIGSTLIVKSGLKEQDRIVTEGVQKLHEGAAVQLGAGSTKK